MMTHNEANRHSWLVPFRRRRKPMICRVLTTALNADKDFDSFNALRDTRLTRLRLISEFWPRVAAAPDGFAAVEF